MRSFRFLVCVLAASAMLGVVSARQADAAIIYLSEISSDDTPASLLSASFEFTVSGNAVTLTVTNLTSAPNGYNINEVYFNVTENVGTLTQVSGNTGWTFTPKNGHATKADGFGVYSYALIDGVGEGNPHVINPGDSKTWVFEFTGTAIDFDFTSAFSTIPPGEHQAVVAAKFVSGPDGDSSFGATTTIVIPAPGAAVLLLAAFAGRTRRRH